MSGLINVYGSMAMHGSLSVREDGTSFPLNPRIGQFSLMDGVLFIYALLDGNKTWYPLTNERNAYVHVQGLANTQWNVGHGFGTENILYVVYDENNVVQQVSADFIDDDNIQLNFSEAESGRCLVFCTAENFGQQVTTNLLTVGSVVIAGASISVNGTDIVAIINNLKDAAFMDVGETSDTVAVGDHTQPISRVDGLQDELDLKEDRVNKGVAGGYPSLDNDGFIPASQLPSSAREIQVVATIAERDNLETYDGLRAHVIDATADSTVEGTWAEYLWASDTWTKTSEADSIDVVLDWDEIQGRPAATVSHIDAAVVQRHVHSNATVLQGTEESFTTTQKLKLDTIADGATNYVHPATHPADIITVTSSKQFVSVAEKNDWNAKLDASTYTGTDILNKLLPVDGTLSGLDADKLDGHEATFFSPASHLHDERYLQKDSKAVDSDLLDGHDSTYYSVDGHTHASTEITDFSDEMDTKQDTLVTTSNVPVGTLQVHNAITATTPSTETIGTSAIPFKEAWIDELHLSQNTLYLGDTPVVGTDADTVMIKADEDQSITVKTKGTGETKVTSENGVEISNSGLNGQVTVQSTGAGGQVSLGATQAINLTAPDTNVSGDLATTGHATFTNATFTGDVTFSGTSTTINSDNVSTTDNIIVLNSGEVGSGVTNGTSGIQIDRGAAADVFFVYDEVSDTFQYGTTTGMETVPAKSYVDTQLDTKVTSESGKGLSTNDFTDTLLTKLDAVEPGATNYVHPTYNGDDLSAVQATLSGGEVVSGIELHVNSDTNGHVTGASSSITTRTLTPANIGALSAGATAVAANRLATARTIDITGDITATAVAFDGSANIAISASVNNDSHTHDTRYYTESESDGRFLGIAAKAADANLLDGHDSAYFAPQSTTYNKTEVDTKVASLIDSAPGTLDTLNELAAALGDDPNFATTITNQIATKLNASSYTAGDVLAKIKTVDGSGSGLDADLLDGHDSSYFLTTTGTAAKATKLATARTIDITGDITATAVAFDGTANIAISASVNNDSHTHDTRYYTESESDGRFLGIAAKAADADKLDGVTSSSFLRSDTTDYLTATTYSRGDIVVEDAYRNRGVFGTYNSAKTQHIWSMGTSYRNAADGSTFGNLYGLAYKYNLNGSGHGIHVVQNGAATTSLGSSIWTSGNVTAYSDIRVKTNLEIIPEAINKVKQIAGYTFDRTDTPDGETPKRQTGVVAQELIKVLPEAVVGGPTEEDPDAMYSVAYGNIVGLLIEAVKEQDAHITGLEEKLSVQSARLDGLETRLANLEN